MNRIINKEYIKYSGTPFFMSVFLAFRTQYKACARLTLNVRTLQLRRGHVLLKTTVRFFIELSLGIFIYKKEVSAE